jgi:hypothetical protein
LLTKQIREYVTAEGSTKVPWECANTYNGMDCWSTRVVTITATNVTQASKPPVAHSMLANVGSVRHAPTAQTVDLLVKQNVLKKELMNPSKFGMLVV